VRVRPLADQWAGNQQDLHRRIRALETQQNSYVTDIDGNVIMQSGYIAGTYPAQHGTLVSDDSGNVRLQLGTLPDGDFGLAYFTPGTSIYQTLWPLVSDYADATISTESTSWTALAGSPTVTAVLGASGDAMVTVSAFIGMGVADSTCSIGLAVDGGSPEQWVALSSASTVGVNATTVRQLSKSGIGALTKGPHTFTLQYMTTDGSADANFSAQCLVVEPI